MYVDYGSTVSHKAEPTFPYFPVMLPELGRERQ